MQVYSELFEYAGQLVRNFIDSEAILTSSNPDDLFGESSWQSNFFCFNLSLLKDKLIRDQAEKLLESKEDEQRPYNAALARVSSLYINLVIGCGKEHVDSMIQNCVNAIVAMNNISEKNQKPIAKIFQEHPILIVSALGNAYFVTQKINYLRHVKIRSNLSAGSRK